MAMDEKEQEAQQRRLAKHQKNVADEIDKAFNTLLSTYGGRKLLWWLLEIGQVNTQPFRGEPERTAFACGELNVGNRILARIVGLNPDGYLTMLKETQNERNALARPDTSTDSRSGSPGSYDDESGTE